jgi:hypothetical protein
MEQISYSTKTFISLISYTDIRFLALSHKYYKLKKANKNTIKMIKCVLSKKYHNSSFGGKSPATLDFLVIKKSL